MKKPLLVLILFAAASSVAAAPPAPPTVPPIHVDGMKETVKTLASDAFEGRAPGTAAELKVLAYIVKRFKQAGLKPGNHGKWLQDVPTVTLAAENRSPLTITGGRAPLSYTFGDDWVAASFRFAPHTEVKDSDLVFVGYGIVAPELGWNDYAGIDMHGKTAVILVNDPDYAQADESGPFKGRRMTYYGRWTYKFEEAARQGATAALIVHDTFPAAYGWNVIHSSWTGPQHYVATPGDNMDQTLANGWIQKPVAQTIFAAAGQDFAKLSEAAGQKGFKPVPLGLKASVSFDSTITRALSHNVIGIQPGKTRPREYVLYSAHWDHFGHCPAVNGDDICNGAVDNATGVAGLVALAEANHEAGPAPRSQLFIALTLEESGLLGSKYYAENPVYPLAKTVGGVNMDILLPGGRTRDYTQTGGDKSDLTALLRSTLTADGLVEAPEAHPERGSYYRSDHFSFAKLGVPVYSVDRGTDLVIGGKAVGEAQRQDYTSHRYHQPSDEYSPTWDWTGPLEDVALFYQLGRSLADSKAWPNWNPGDEFRAARDRSRPAK